MDIQKMAHMLSTLDRENHNLTKALDEARRALQKIWMFRFGKDIAEKSIIESERALRTIDKILGDKR